MQMSKKTSQILDNFWEYCKKNQYFNKGYPESASFDYSHLFRFFQFSMNNCGDWRTDSNYPLNTFSFEREVIYYFSNLFLLPIEESWGYVTNGGTEGNLFACYVARSLFPTGNLYCSDQTHYSVVKIANLLRINLVEIPSSANGELRYDLLAKSIKEHNDKTPIIFANIGSTMLGAIDDISLIQNTLADLGIPRQDYFLHADAALSGMILPFVDNPNPFNFNDGIDSIAISGHKMIGMPIPCGIVLTRQHFLNSISKHIDYIDSLDHTISGSRNAHSVLMFWYAIQQYSLESWKKRIRHCLNLAECIEKKLNSFNINTLRNRNSITIAFPKPSENVWKKHYLATTNSWSHLIALPHHQDINCFSDILSDLILDLT